MHHAFSVALVGLFTLASVATADGEDDEKPVTRIREHQVSVTYSLQTVSVRAGCFPAKLKLILAHIAATTGRRPLVTSGYRPHSGRSGSYHRKCMAADIRIPGVSAGRIIAAAESAPGIGGLGSYCNGIVHVDIGPKRRWGGCRRH
ncbi:MULTISPECIES: YcbK family protein [unclassified Sinorhizobium]|uniref:YcbK family protein n=1 Tax=unclassified Sinorhizobium TaxID=2613772 RepID=UPI00352500CC